MNALKLDTVFTAIKSNSCLVASLTETPSQSNYYSTQVSVLQFNYERIKRIRTLYQLKNSALINSFLLENNLLTDLLSSLHQVAVNYFGINTMSIELVEDSELEGWKNIIISIQHTFSDQEGESRLESFILKWFVKRDKDLRKLIILRQISSHAI